MAMTSKSKTGLFRITNPASILTVSNLEDDVGYDWIRMQGRPALKERK